MVRNFAGEPYTQKDADRFKQMLKNYGNTPAPEFAKRDHVRPGEKGNAKRAINILRTIVKEVHDIYADATRAFGSNFLVQELGRYVAWTCQVDMIPGPIKSHGGAYRKMGLTNAPHDKVDQKERYESAGQLKDIARITLCANSPQEYSNTLTLMRKFCVPVNKMGLKKDDELVADKNPCGYSGANMVAILPNKRFGEVQANVRSIMFGKMTKSDFCRDLGVTVDGYLQLSMRYGIEGGLGHVFYEIYRVDKTGANGLEAARLSTLYYSLLRLPAADRGKNMFFKRGFEAFRQKNASAFAGHH